VQALLRSSAAAMGDAARDRAGAGAGGGTGSAGAAGLWRGLRTFLVDGTGTITPDTPALRKAFGQPSNQKAGCGFPVPKLLALFDAFTGMVVELLAFPLYTHDLRGAWRLHPLLAAGDLLVGDRGFCSYGHLALLHLRGVLACFHMHQRTHVDFRPHRPHNAGRKGKGGRGRKGRRGVSAGLPTSRFVRRLGRWDQLVEWNRPATRPKWMTAAQLESLPPTLLVREVRYVLKQKGMRARRVTVATTLLDPIAYPRDEVAALYGRRWRAETHLAELKTTLGMRKLKSRTRDGVKKELAVYCLVYNLVHAVIAEAAARQHTTPDRVGFTDALRWLLTAEPGEPVPDLVLNPRRPGRHEPRVIKDLRDTYRKMVLPRHAIKKQLHKWRGRPK
jgi:DDE family transposase